MAGFQRAAKLGVDVLELDLALTRENVLVVAHDPQVNAALCSGVEALPAQRFADLTWDQIKGLDCGSKPNPRFPDQRPAPGQTMPRLAQVLDLLEQHPRLRVNIEIKTFPEHPQWTRPPELFALELATLLRQRGLAARAVVQSFDPAALQAMRRIAPGQTLAALADRRGDFDRMLSVTGATILSPRHTELTALDLPRYHGRGVRVVPWTVNSPPRMTQLMRWGVDGIITDRPDLLLALLK